MELRVNDYVRTKKRGFQCSQIAKIKSMEKDEGYKNQYFIDLDHNLLPDYEYQIYEEDILKSSPNIIDLIQVGDYVNGRKVFLKTDGIDKHLRVTDENGNWGIKYIYEDDIKSIVTKEMFSSVEYKL